VIYVLNSPILTGFGTYQFSGPLSIEESRSRLAGGFTSAVGHAATAEFLARVLGVVVPVNRIAIDMQPGDAALVLRLTERLPEGRMLTAEELKDRHEIGWLHRLS
jgi:hypothetical protein